MIVIGVDVHKQSLTATAVDELGRTLAEHSGAAGGDEVIAWACSLGDERLWALEDCRHVTRGLERALLAAGERLVRVPPRLTGPERRRGRTRGKSDRIDALAIARAALQEPLLEGPRAGERTLRELKLLVDHRDDLVAERRRCQQRLRWHLHELDPSLQVPLGALDRNAWLDRLGRRLGQREQTLQAQIARDLVGRCRSLTRSIGALERQLQERTQAIAPQLLELPGCGPLSAAKLLCEIGPIARFRTDAQLARHAGVAPLEAQASTNATGSTAAATDNSTARSTESPSPRTCPPPSARTWSGSRARARAAARRSAASSDSSYASSTQRSESSPH
jgi:transposase